MKSKSKPELLKCVLVALVSLFSLMILAEIAYAQGADTPDVWVYQSNGGDVYYFQPDTNRFYNSEGNLVGAGSWTEDIQGFYAYSSETRLPASQSGLPPIPVTYVGKGNAEVSNVFGNHDQITTKDESIPDNDAYTRMQSGFESSSPSSDDARQAIASDYVNPEKTSTGEAQQEASPGENPSQNAESQTGEEQTYEQPTEEEKQAIYADDGTTSVYLTRNAEDPNTVTLDGSPSSTDGSGASFSDTYTRTGDGTYTFTDSNGATYEVELSTDANGNPVATIDTGSSEHKLSTAVAEVLSEHNEERNAEAAKESGTRTVTSGEEGEVLPAETDTQTWTAIKNEVRSAGGWFNWAFKGAFVSNFVAIGSLFGEDFVDGGKGSMSDVYDFGAYLTINEWGKRFCEWDSPLKEGNNAIITSDSGRSYAHVEGEETVIDPCMAAPNCNQQEYYMYRISGGISAAEVRMVFKIVLYGEEEHILYPNSESAEQYMTLEQGEQLNLAGANMLVFNYTKNFDKVCIVFNNVDELQKLFGPGALGPFYNENDYEFCQQIVPSEQYDYQRFEPSDGPDSQSASIPGAPNTPGTANIPG